MNDVRTKYEERGWPEPREGEEPFFLLRGQDALAPFAVQTYAALLRSAAAGSESTIHHLPTTAGLREQAADAERIAARMIAWQAEHGHKLPD